MSRLCPQLFYVDISGGNIDVDEYGMAERCTADPDESTQCIGGGQDADRGVRHQVAA